MKSFTSIAAFAGAASAAWAPPAYGGYSSAEESSSAPAAYESSSAPAPPAYGAPSSYAAPETTSSAAAGYATSSSAPAGYYSSSAVETRSAPAYGTSMTTSSAPAYPTGGYGGNATAGYGGDEYVTVIKTSFTTFCPYATTKTYGGHTYTATASETLTITDCPGGCEVPTPVHSYTPEVTTETVSSYTTVCPSAGTYTWGQQTHTATESEVVTVTACPGGCPVTSTKDVTIVVPTYTTVCPSPVAPTTTVIASSTYTYSDVTTITAVAPTSYATVTSVYSSPAAPTSYVVGSSTVTYSDATTVTYTAPTQPGYTMTVQPSQLPSYAAPMPSMPAASSPVSPIMSSAASGYPAPSASAVPSGNNTSPFPPQQTGNGAASLTMGAGAAFAAVFALFL